MNDLSPPGALQEEESSAAQTLFSHYELWLAERMPDANRHAVFWSDEKIDYDQLRDNLETQRKHFIAPSPYPGLRSFTPQEGRVFFGRRADVDEVRERLKAKRMVMVLGGSGSGKSSLIRAGVLPHLNGVGRIGGRGGTWYWCEFRPEQSPIDNFINALAKHVVAPLIDAIALRAEESPDLGERLRTLGLDIGMQPEGVRDWVAGNLTSAFDRELLFDSLWDFVDKKLAELDRLASGGIRAGKPNLLILVDQFEEIFRKGLSQGQQEQVKDLLCLLAKMDEKLRTAPWSEGGLFMAITVRSEELHRCGEHDGLTNIVNRSVFLLELLDASRSLDRKVLHRAIVEPARRVFISYDLPFDRNDPDCPFAPGVPDWLIDGASAQWTTLEHRPDLLPLLQHALRSMWHEAVSRWKREGAKRLVIEKTDLPGDDPETPFPDLDLCLSTRADEAAEEARGRFWNIENDGPAERLTAEQCPMGDLALRAAFSALSRQDDRGNRARRFATIEDMLPFLKNHEAVQGLDALPERLERALSPMIFHGYLSGGFGRPYDISHEALIRNWTQCDRWLRDVEEVSRALRRFLDDVDPDEFDALADTEKLAESLSGSFRAQIGRIGENRTVPEAAAIEQIDLMLRASAERRRRWLGEDRAHEMPTSEDNAAVLVRIKDITARSLEARKAIREEQARAEERVKQIEVVKASAKKARRRMKLAAGFALASLVGFVGAAFLGGSVAASSQVLADGSVLGRAAQDDLQHGVRLGILEAARPDDPSRLWRWLQPNAQADALRLQWDGLARRLLGSNFWLAGSPTSPAPPPAVCWIRSGNEWQPSSNQTNGSFSFESTSRSLQIAPGGGSLNVLIQPTRRGSPPAKPFDLLRGAALPALGPGSQLCVSQDASIVTASTAGSSVPNVYEHILHCSDTCQSSLLPIRASIVPRAPNSRRPETASLTRSAITPANPGSPDVTNIGTAADGLVRIAFDVESTHYQASFYRGWAMPRRISHRRPSAVDCAEEQPGSVWRCPGEAPYVMLRRPGVTDGPPQDGAELMTLEMRTRNDPGSRPRLIALVPPEMRGIAVDGTALVLTDGVGDLWTINVDEQGLARLVDRLGDRNNIPTEILDACVAGLGCDNASIERESERSSR